MVTAVYFSGTGRTENCIKKITKIFKDDVNYINITSLESRNSEYVFNENDIVIVAMPVYAGQIPAVYNIIDCLKGNNTPCIIIACYGNRDYDDTLAQMSQLLQKRGFIIVGGGAIIIEHTFANELGKNRPNESDMEKIEKWICEIKNKIDNKNYKNIEFKGNPFVEPKKSIPVPKTVNADKCVLCGKCVKECPVADIVINDKVEFKNENCINCMRCSVVCPNNCISYNCEPLTKRLMDNFLNPKELELFV